jgi:hypothetical protein
MRTFRYHALFAPQGRIFDTTGATAEKPPVGGGWVEHFGEQAITPAEYADRVIERAVKEELAKQGPHRKELETEHEKKFGVVPHNLAPNEEVANVMDNKTVDGKTKMHVAGLPKGKPRP